MLSLPTRTQNVLEIRSTALSTGWKRHSQPEGLCRVETSTDFDSLALQKNLGLLTVLLEISSHEREESI